MCSEWRWNVTEFVFTLLFYFEYQEHKMSIFRICLILYLQSTNMPVLSQNLILKFAPPSGLFP